MDSVTPDRGFGPDPNDPECWVRDAFRLIEGWPGYCIGRDGSAWTCKNTHGVLGDQWRRLKGSPNTKGYLGVKLHNRGRKRSVAIYRLVLEAFVGPCPPGMESCHNNGIRTDNRLEILRWDTKQANNEDKLRHGSTSKGSSHPRATVTESDVVEMRRLRAGGMQVKDIAAMYSLHPASMSRILTGEKWAHVEGALPRVRRPKRIDPDHVPEIFKLRSEGWSQKKIGDLFGYHSTVICRLLNGKSHSRLSGIDGGPR